MKKAALLSILVVAYVVALVLALAPFAADAIDRVKGLSIFGAPTSRSALSPAADSTAEPA